MEQARIFAVFALVLIILLVSVRVILLHRRGVEAMKFGAIDKSDFLIPPFGLFYLYVVVAAAFGLPTVTHDKIFSTEITAWPGAVVCFAGVGLFVWSLVSFGESFRVGIDQDRPDKLIMTGVFRFTRNPIYLAFTFLLTGEFLAFPNPVLLIYLFAAIALFHRQVLREEKHLREHYGASYLDYVRRVPRYL
jgi:protein-S-isoprenylcysteine O-methyltransferase Ste14